MSKLHAFKNNFQWFARNFLKIKDKSGRLVPFAFNQAQQIIHEKLKEQFVKMGYIRAIILKGRQQGCSTYIEGRFFHRAITREGVNVFILSHEAKTTTKLFDMVERYYENMEVGVKPKKGAANANQLKFDDLDSEYTVGTAGNESTGRGGTVRLFHGSEVAFWQRTEGIQTGVMESVPSGLLAKGTEIILESTANGMQGMFYQMAMAALKKKSEYILIFIPWFIQDEYRLPLPDDFELTDEEEEYKNLYKLDDMQVYWRRMKIESFVNDGKSIEQAGAFFKQEYPANVHEAFQASGTPFFSVTTIMRARNAPKYNDKTAPIILTCDPSGDGGDRTVYLLRQGRDVLWYKSTHGGTPMEKVAKMAQLIDKYEPDAVFIDHGYGEAIADRLKELGYNVITVKFGGKSSNSKYLNKRVEMYFLAREYMEEGCSIPDSDEFHADIASIPKERQTSSNKFKLPNDGEVRRGIAIGS